MKTTTRIFYSVMIFFEIGAIIALLLSAGSFIIYGNMEEELHGIPNSGTFHHYNQNFFSSDNKIIDGILWLQRNMLYREVQDNTIEHLYFNPFALFLIIFCGVAYYFTKVKRIYDAPTYIFVTVCRIIWYLSAVYYSFITAWWLYQELILGNHLATPA